MDFRLALRYNRLGVAQVARVEDLVAEVEKLSVDELREFLARLREKLELLGWLSLAESAFSDWDNEEDACYDAV